MPSSVPSYPLTTFFPSNCSALINGARLSTSGPDRKTNHQILILPRFSSSLFNNRQLNTCPVTTLTRLDRNSRSRTRPIIAPLPSWPRLRSCVVDQGDGTAISKPSYARAALQTLFLTRSPPHQLADPDSVASQHHVAACIYPWPAPCCCRCCHHHASSFNRRQRRRQYRRQYRRTSLLPVRILPSCQPSTTASASSDLSSPRLPATQRRRGPLARFASASRLSSRISTLAAPSRCRTSLATVCKAFASPASSSWSWS